MKLILQNHAEEYAAREIITSYLPKIKIEIADSFDKSEDYTVSSLLHNNEEYVYSTLLFLNGKEYQSSVTEKEYNKTYVKKSIDIALKNALDIDLPWGLITGIRPSKLVRELSETGLNPEEIREKFKTFYKCSDDKTNLAIEIAYREKKLIDSMPKNSVSLYVGIPFCPTRCLYCSFTSQSVKFSNTLTEPYLDALEKEIKHTAELIKNNGLEIDTVYIGGGTPTALSANQLQKMLGDLHTHFDLSNIREFTLEAGRPDTIDDDKLKIIRDFNIGRISINPQTMNQKTLDIIGRKHTPKDIIRTYEMAVKYGFNHINTDLIAGLPNENEEDLFIHLKKSKSLIRKV